MREIAGGGSYLSQSDLRGSFGLGRSVQAETIQINWPSGQVDTFSNVKADQFYLASEGSRHLHLQQFCRSAAQMNTSQTH
jgi:enediyne biosynthesis protein E4